MPKHKTKLGRNNKLIVVGVVLSGIVLSAIATYLATNAYFAKKYEGTCYSVEFKRICSGSLVGLEEASAIKKVKDEGFNPVVVQRDGKNIFRSFVGDPYRVSLWVSDEHVTKVEFYK